MTDASVGLWLVALGFGGAAVGSMLLWAVRRSRRWWRWPLRMLAVPVLVVGLACLWLRYRPWPTTRSWQPHRAVTIDVSTRDDPRPMVLHVARIELSHPGLEVVTSRPRPDGKFAATTTAQFVRDEECVVAVNSHFFTPFSSRRPWDFYPRIGDPVRAVGFAAADGTVHSAQRWREAIVHFDRRARASAGTPDPASIWDAVGGRNILVDNGEALPLPDLGAAPRTALGFSDDGQTLFFAVVDGRQPGYSEGMTVPELAEFMAGLGCEHAIELDGGGSATMVVDSGSGAEVINTPMHTRIPGRLRPVAAHVGIRIGPPSAR